MMLLAALLVAPQAPAPSVRDAQREALRFDVSRTNGAWRLHEWGHYFVVTDVRDPELLEQLERHAFEARECCSRLFPEAECDPVRDDRKLPVLRVLRDQQEYQSYGGYAGSTGYWSTVSNEMVVYDDRDRSLTRDALRGLAVREFLDEYFGNPPRASWFEEGLAEYAAGLGSGFHPAREERLRRAEFDPRMTFDELLGSASRDLPPASGICPDPRLASWTFMRFLCDEAFHGPGFDARWARIPERYAVGWLDFRDEPKAREFALEGLDRVALERAWRASLHP
jgi:hypothetical protein